ncbi:stabilizer of axonemal microtubules 1-like [Cydia amplana]|uniref:stabilizer of axonemal microtubules 1-like n=1 Tax=Cydia amplana TaxID=1869771 RepID=UPI002FE66749
MSECVPCEACRSCGKVLSPCYKQPRIPDSFAPRRCYVKPTAPVEASTTYNLSYLPTADSSNLRGIPRKPAPNLVPSCEPMEGSTVQKLSFLPNEVCTTQPIRPCHHDMWGQGPMQAVTTHRHDYVPKPSIMRESCKPPPKFHSVESPFENRTVNRLSYVNPGPAPPAPSFAPVKCYERPVAKMDSSTTQKMSYQPVCAPSPQRPPWACKGQYQKPCQKIDSTTVYRSSFLPPGEDCSQVLDPCSYGDCKPCNCICPAQCIATDPCSCLTFPRAGC